MGGVMLLPPGIAEIGAGHAEDVQLQSGYVMIVPTSLFKQSLSTALPRSPGGDYAAALRRNAAASNANPDDKTRWLPHSMTP
jgi:hypothetical protein